MYEEKDKEVGSYEAVVSPVADELIVSINCIHNRSYDTKITHVQY